MLVDSMNAGVGVASPAWITAGAGAFDMDQLKRDVMERVANDAPFQPTIFENSVIAPLTLGEYTFIAGALTCLCADPFLVAAFNASPNQEPIATLGYIADGTRVRAVASMVLPVPPNGVKLFAT